MIMPCPCICVQNRFGPKPKYWTKNSFSKSFGPVKNKVSLFQAEQMDQF